MVAELIITWDCKFVAMSDDTDTTIFCSNCRAVLSADVEFCTECGAEQNVPSNTGENLEPDFLPATKKYCGNCGDIIDQGASYCGSCGHRINSNDKTSSEEHISDWLIGLSPNNTLQNIVAIVFFYFLLYPLGIPVLMYSYLYNKKKLNKLYVLAMAIILGVVLFISVLII